MNYFQQNKNTFLGCFLFIKDSRKKYNFFHNNIRHHSCVYIDNNQMFFEQ